MPLKQPLFEFKATICCIISYNNIIKYLCMQKINKCNFLVVYKHQCVSSG